VIWAKWKRNIFGREPSSSLECIDIAFLRSALLFEFGNQEFDGIIGHDIADVSPSFIESSDDLFRVGDEIIQMFVY
jgi:hypothetical protein